MVGAKFELSALGSLPDSVIAVDQDGTISFANSLAETMFGFGEGELIGKALNILIPERFGESHRRHTASFLAAPRTRPMGVGLRLFGRRKDGSEFPAEISLSPVNLGDRLFVVSVIRNITARQDMESRLRLQIAALEASANGIVITDRDGKITWANSAFSRSTGYKLEEVQNQNPRILRSGVHDQQFYKILWDTILAGHVWHGEIVNRRKDGSLYTEEQSIAPVRDENGEITHFVAVKQDVSARKQAEEALEKQRVYLSALHEVTIGLLARQELKELLKDIVERAEQLVGTSSGFLFMVDSVRGRLIPVISTGALVDVVASDVERGAGLVGRVWETGEPLAVADYDAWAGRSLDVNPGLIRAVVGVPLKNKSEVIGVLGLAYDYRSHKTFQEDEVHLLMRFAQLAALTVDNAQLYEATQELATRDPLTGIFNRRHLFDLGRLELERARRYSQPLAAIMLDIDRFKNLNDTWGHQAGDLVLRSVADSCRLHLREVDLLARYGGDEFVILLPYTSVGQAAHVADRIRSVVSSTPIAAGTGDLSVTVSIGVVEYVQNMSSLEPLLERADQALFAAKRHGRNRVERWRPEYAQQTGPAVRDSLS